MKIIPWAINAKNVILCMLVTLLKADGVFRALNIVTAIQTFALLITVLEQNWNPWTALILMTLICRFTCEKGQKSPPVASAVIIELLEKDATNVLKVILEVKITRPFRVDRANVTVMVISVIPFMETSATVKIILKAIFVLVGLLLKIQQLAVGNCNALSVKKDILVLRKEAINVINK